MIYSDGSGIDAVKTEITRGDHAHYTDRREGLKLTGSALAIEMLLALLFSACGVSSRSSQSQGTSTSSKSGESVTQIPAKVKVVHDPDSPLAMASGHLQKQGLETDDYFSSTQKARNDIQEIANRLNTRTRQRC